MWGFANASNLLTVMCFHENLIKTFMKAAGGDYFVKRRLAFQNEQHKRLTYDSGNSGTRSESFHMMAQEGDNHAHPKQVLKQKQTVSRKEVTFESGCNNQSHPVYLHYSSLQTGLKLLFDQESLQRSKFPRHDSRSAITKTFVPI